MTIAQTDLFSFSETEEQVAAVNPRCDKCGQPTAQNEPEGKKDRNMFWCSHCGTYPTLGGRRQNQLPDGRASLNDGVAHSPDHEGESGPKRPLPPSNYQLGQAIE